MVLKVCLKILQIVLFYVFFFFVENFILAEELFAKALPTFETYVFVNNNL